MLRYLLVSLLLGCAGGVGLGQASGPKIFCRLTVNQTHIALSYAGDIGIVERAGGEARRLTNHPEAIGAFIVAGRGDRSGCKAFTGTLWTSRPENVI